jgi:hypothetical protein
MANRYPPRIQGCEAREPWDSEADRVADCDADGAAALRAVVAASSNETGFRQMRVAFGYGLVGISVLVWIAAAWPTLLPIGLWRLAVGLWPTGFAGFLLSGAFEAIWRRSRLRALARLGDVPARLSWDRLPDDIAGSLRAERHELGQYRDRMRSACKTRFWLE